MPTACATLETQETTQETGAGIGQRTFAGHEYDVESGLSYMGARYYDGSLGRFLSEDPLFLAIGTDLRKYGKTQDEILADPQQMNAYSYARNNPLIYVDNTGEASTLAWMMNPIGTAAQVLFWKLGSVGFDRLSSIRGGGMAASSAFMQHSLSLNPGSISITRDNQSNYGNIVDQITDSKAYNDATSRFIATAESKGLTSANSSSFDDGFEQSVSFGGNNDLFASIGKATNFHVEGSKDTNGTWSLNVNLKDNYNFERGNYDNKSFGVLNNAAVGSQAAQAISPYSIDIQFSSKKKK